MPSRRNKHKQFKQSKKAIKNAHFGRHRRVFRYSLSDIRAGNWYLRPTQTWVQYMSSFFW